MKTRYVDWKIICVFPMTVSRFQIIFIMLLYVVPARVVLSVKSTRLKHKGLLIYDRRP